MLHLSRSIPGVAAVLIASVVTLSVWSSTHSPSSIQAAPAWRAPQAGIVSTCDEPSFKNALAGGGTVTFSCSGIITLTASAVITAPTTIDGTGQAVTLSGGGAVRIITTTAGVGMLTMQNITLTHGVVNSGAFPDNGGGALFVRGNLVLTDVTVISNTAYGGSGGAYVIGAASMNGGLFQHNTSTNSAGGGLWAISTLALTGMQFLSNTAAGAGGGAVALGAASVIGGLFQNNTSTSYAGGGLYAGSTLALTGTQFLSNTATSDGGGLYHSAGPGRVVNALFALNRAGGNGADLALHSPGQVVILHTTLANPASGGGAAIDIVAGTLGITDTIIANHTIGISNTGGLVFEDYNLFFGNRNSTTGSIAGGAHDVVDDPMFVDPAYDNYHLKPGSAAIDRGVAAGVPFDIDGDPRPFGAGYDIGYDEWVNYPIYLPLVLRNY